MTQGYALIGNLLCLFLNYLFTCHILTPKRNRWLTCMILFAGSAWPMIASAIYPGIPLIIAGWSPIAMMILLTLFLFSDKIKDKLLFLLYSILATMLISGWESVLSGLHMLKEDLLSFPTACLLFLPTYAAFSGLMLLYMRIKKKHLSNKDFNRQLALFTFFPVSQVALIVTVILAINGEKSVSDFAQIKPFISLLAAISTLFCVAADTILFYLMVKNAQRLRLQAELEFRAHQNELYAAYYQSMQRDIEAHQKMHHDLNNILQIAYIMQEKQPECGEQATPLLAALQAQIQGLHMEEYSPNALVNAIVSNKLRVCRELGVAAEIGISIPAQLPLEDIDLCRAFTNMLDNAINAFQKMPAAAAKQLSLQSNIKDGYLYIHIKNSAVRETAAQERRGYGKAILREIAEKYNGEFIGEYLDDGDSVHFEALLALNVPSPS